MQSDAGYVLTADAERADKEARFAALLADKQRRQGERQREEEVSAEEAGLEAERRPLLDNLAEFLKFAWSIHKPGRPLVWSWHYELLAEYMQLVYERKILYFVCNVPPRTLKTVFLSVAFPCWVWAKDPLPSFIGGSFDGELADGLNDYRRKIIKSPAYQRLFGHRARIQTGRDRIELFANTVGGEMRATSHGSGITGRGGDFLLLDDILSPAQADSPKIGPSVTEWVDETFLQRRNDISRSPLVLIEQRVHEADMTAHLLKTSPKEETVHLSIPLVAEDETTYVFPISGRVHVRPRGDVLMPSVFTPTAVAALKLRSRVYFTQYQGKPTAKGGKTFQRDWFKWYGPKDKGYDVQLPTRCDEYCQSWDCTFKAKSDSDMVAGHVYGRKGADRFLIDRVADRMTFTQTLKAMAAMMRKHPYAKRVLVEDKANGTAIIDTMRTQVGGIVAVEPIGSKEARAEASTLYAESGNVYLPCPEIAPWVNEFLDFICAFPGPLNDDDVDAFSQGMLKMKRGNGGLFDFYSRRIAEYEEPVPSVFDVAEGMM